MAERGRSAQLQVSRRPVAGSGGAIPARHSPVDSELRRRIEPIAPRRAPPRRIHVSRKPAPRFGALRALIEQNLLAISCALLVVGVTGWALALYSQFRASGLIGAGPSSTYAETALRDAAVTKADAAGVSSYAPTVPPRPVAFAAAGAAPTDESAASVIARDWSYFDVRRNAGLPARIADLPREPARPAKAAAPVRTASAASERPTPQMLAGAPSAPPIPTLPRMPVNIQAKTSLVGFETAPFPYHGALPGSNRPFLGADDQRAHVNFRGRVFWESKTFSDDRVLLHIPAGFDPSRPAVMVVFFHGHGATLARDVRDRQRLPDQISAAGLNAVLVAPQFAFDAADSSAGKFWQPDGFKRFLDEAARKLAALYGDGRSAAAFGNMPIVLVAYSGGFGPTLSVLARGGAQSRIRGLVLMDALYAGIDQFADWIADNRSTFFVSSYTPHTAHHNADLEHALAERSVAYTSTLRRNHLQGMVAFVPTGDISHRDFVTRAWTDNPVEDVLLRMTDTVPTIDPPAVASARRD